MATTTNTTTTTSSVFKNLSLAYSSKSSEDMYIDDDIDSKVNPIKKDIKKIIADVEAIKKAYNTLKTHKATKGYFYDATDSCVKKCNDYIKNLRTVQNNTDRYVLKSATEYYITFINGAKKMADSAKNIDTNSSVNI